MQLVDVEIEDLHPFLLAEGNGLFAAQLALEDILLAGDGAVGLAKGGFAHAVEDILEQWYFLLSARGGRATSRANSHAKSVFIEPQKFLRRWAGLMRPIGKTIRGSAGKRMPR